MNANFKAKFLQNFVSKKKGNEGFTLIELLVVIIIVGVLAAIALPSFLSQIGKARGSEAKSAMGVVNRSQQAYRLENNSFAPGSTYLDAKLSPKFYTYSSAATGRDNATSTGTPLAAGTDLKSYAAGIAQGTNDEIKMSICESVSASGATGYAAAAASAAGGTTTPTAGCTTGRLLE